MGKKYIIEIEDKPFHKGNGDFLYRVKGFNSLVFDMTGIGMLTPYTEPDLEQIRKEAYERGRKDVETQFCSYDACKNRQEEYQRGLADAWEAARKICLDNDDGGIPTSVVNDIFNVRYYRYALRDFSATEAIEKIRQYEPEKEEQIQVGDEVISPGGKGVVTEITDIYVRIMYEKGSGQVIKPEELTKTGRHFPEIAEVLEKMRGEQDG